MILRSILQYYPRRSSSYGSAELSLAISQMSQYCYRYRSEKLPDNGPALGDTDTETRWAFEHRQSNAPPGSHNVSNFYECDNFLSPWSDTIIIEPRSPKTNSN